MKGDVGMSRHEKEREQEDAYTTQSINLGYAKKNLFLFVINVRQTKEHKCILISKFLHRVCCDIGRGKYERVSAGTISILHRIILR